MSDKKETAYTRLFELFAGTYVTIAVKSLRGVTSSKKISNVMLAGYLLDECETFYYIGDTPTEVFAAVRRDDVISIMMGREGDMETVEIPEGQSVQ